MYLHTTTQAVDLLGKKSLTSDITGIVAGNGLTGDATSGDASLAVGAGNGITVNTDTVEVNVSDFMTNGSNNRILTATGTDAMNAEANLTFDGSTLDVSGDVETSALNHFRAKYNSSDDYSSMLYWSTLQLGNNGANRIVSGRTAAGSSLEFYVNNSNNVDANTTTPNGTKALVLNSNGTLDCKTAGTASAPSLHFAGDSDTGLFRAASNTIALTTGGTERVRIDSSGRMGIGTDSPSHKLHVAGAIGINDYINHNNDANTYMGFDGNDSYRVVVAGVGMIYASTTEVSINEDSADRDFRVESNNKDKALFVNGGTDHVQASVGVETITQTSGTINLDADEYGVFRITSDLTGATTLNIRNMQEGQVIDITVSGSQTITFSSDDTTETFNKVGGVDYDGASDNHIQVICIDDTDSAAIYHYSIGTYTSDTTP